MRFLLDENIDYRLVSFLEDLGHDVTSMIFDYQRGSLDHEALFIAYREQRILITDDAGDFGSLVFQQHLPHAGIILFRLKEEQTNLQLRKERLSYVLSHHSDQLQHFVVVTPQLVRIRKKPTS
jgi:predicted nuclease of predicted toxin-antitoxin system